MNLICHGHIILYAQHDKQSFQRNFSSWYSRRRRQWVWNAGPENPADGIDLPGRRQRLRNENISSDFLESLGTVWKVWFLCVRSRKQGVAKQQIGVEGERKKLPSLPFNPPNLSLSLQSKGYITIACFIIIIIRTYNLSVFLSWRNCWRCFNPST